MSERRYRLYDHEVPEVKEGLRLRLERLLEKKNEPESAEIAFRVLYRLERWSKGRPKYPEFSWTNLELYLKQYAVRLD